MNTMAVGGDMKVSDRMLVGAMFGYTDNKGDFGGAGGGYKLRQPVGTRLRGLRRRPVVRRRDASARAASTTRTSLATSRSARALRTESGRRPRLRVHRARMLGGYWFTHEGLHARSVRARRLHESRSSSSSPKRARTARR